MKPYYAEDGITIYHGDCREIELPAADLLLTDPPFNVGKDYGTYTDDVSEEAYRSAMKRLVATGPALQGWVVPNKHWRFFADLLHDAPPIIIHRRAIGPIRWGWHDQYDMVMVQGKPPRPWRNLWDDIRLRGEGYFFNEEWYDHPGYTPRAIFDRLIGLMLAEPGTVVDPFAGTGTSLVAAKAAGHRAIGIEIEERYCEIAVQRLAQGVLNFEGSN
jgi:site-specific DNA-methyltransferase (adenine-specific)